MDRTRCSRQHTSPLSASWNIHGQPGTAAQHRAAQTRDHLFIYFITLLPGCLMHNNSSTYKSIFSPSCFSQSHSPHPFSLHSVSFIGTVPLIHKHAKLHICGYFDGSFPLLPFLLISISLSLALFLSLTFIRQMGGA